MIKIESDTKISRWAESIKEYIESFNELNVLTSRFAEHGRIEYLNSNTGERFLANLTKKEGEVFVFKYNLTN